MASRIPLGELLVEAQVITREQLEEVLAVQKTDGRRIGTLLVESGLVTETQVTQILSQQLAVPWVSLYHIDFSRQLLNLVPRELAEAHCMVPIFVRRVRGVGDTLYVAMDDPSDERAQRELANAAGLPVRAMIAPPSDIRSAIRVYYAAGSESSSLSEAVAEERQHQAEAPETSPIGPAVRVAETEPGAPVEAPSAQPPAPEAAAPEAAAPEPPAPEPPAPEPPAPEQPPVRHTPPPDSGPEISAREIALPEKRRGKGARMITLTLLDGTQLNLPSRGAPKGAEDDKSAARAELTARDLVVALRAVAHGADAKEVLGDEPRWEAMFAALLSVLLKKHLIADWEFVDEFKKG
jgi:type IV pilus assembly protein PilB